MEDDRVSARDALLTMLVWAGLSAGFVAQQDVSGTPAVAFLVGLLAFALIAVLHELLHLAVALALGLRVVEMRIGVGPRIATRTVRGLGVSIHAVPVEGGVRWRHNDDDYFGWRSRLKHAAVALAGVGVEVTALAVALAVPLRTDVRAPVVVAAAVSLLENLAPFGYLQRPSHWDVRAAFRALACAPPDAILDRLPLRQSRRAAPHVRAMHDTFLAGDVTGANHAITALAPYADPGLARCITGKQWIACRWYAEGIQVLLPVIDDKDPVAPAALAEALNALAWALLVAPTHVAPTDASERSLIAARAMVQLESLGPLTMAAVDTLALVRVVEGRVAEGVELAHRCEQRPLEPNARATAVATRALAAAAEGEFAAASRLAAEARALDAECEVLPLVDVAIAEMIK